MYRIYISSLLCLLLASGCGEDFLQTEPQQSISIDGAVVDLTSLNASVNGLYNNLQDDNLYNWDMMIIPAVMSDNVYISSKNSGRYLQQDEYRTTPENGDYAGIWFDIYQHVVNASNVINNFPEAEFLDSELAEADHRLGEAYAHRALGYWLGVKVFARPYNFTADGSHLGIPIVNGGTTGEIIEPGRNTVDEVYDAIISDFTTAIPLLSLEEDGRFTQEAAQALLAKVYLFKEDWTNAEAMASEVINSGKYTLYDETNWLDSWSQDFASESLLEVINLPVDNPGVNSIGGIYDQNGYGDALATEDLYNIYSETDVRRAAMTRGDRLDAERGALFVTAKFPKGELGEDNIKVIRLSEVYLIRAEARAELGDEPGARDDLNAVALRVDPSASPITASGEALIDAIILERRKELAFEGARFWDLVRRNMTWTKFRTLDIQFEVNWDRTETVAPIPQIELDVNPQMVQNEGYN